MTRIEKYVRLRAEIERENMELMFKDFNLWNYIRTHQTEIKKELGCKH